MKASLDVKVKMNKIHYREVGSDIIESFEHRHKLPGIVGGSFAQVERARELRQRLVSEASDMLVLTNDSDVLAAYDLLKKQVIAGWWLARREMFGISVMRELMTIGKELQEAGIPALFFVSFTDIKILSKPLAFYIPDILFRVVVLGWLPP